MARGSGAAADGNRIAELDGVVAEKLFVAAKSTL
jgi:hypothetical protein